MKIHVATDNRWHPGVGMIRSSGRRVTWLARSMLAAAGALGAFIIVSGMASPINDDQLVPAPVSQPSAGAPGASGSPSGPGFLFVDTARPDTATPSNKPTIARSRLVDVKFNVLGTPDGPPGAAPAAGSTVVLNLFDDLIFTAALDRVERANPPSGYVWIGHVLGASHSQVTLVVTDGLMTGQITVEGQVYQVWPLANGVHAIYQIDQSKFRPD